MSERFLKNFVLETPPISNWKSRILDLENPVYLFIPVNIKTKFCYFLGELGTNSDETRHVFRNDPGSE